MRMRCYLLLAAALAVMTGCQSSAAPSVAGGAATSVIPVGPIPGAASSISYRTNPLANNPVSLQEGRKLFDWYNCSGCHGGHAGGGMGPSLRDQVWIYGNRDDQIFDSIASGRANGMPSWGTKIPEQQIWELVTYVKSMRTDKEPDPPTVPAHEEVAPTEIKNPPPAEQRN